MPSTMASCAVCLDNNVRFPSASPTERCAHNPNICTDCLSQYIRSEVKDSGNPTIVCPSTGCSAQLTFQEVCTTISDKELLERYNSKLLREALRSDRTFVWCKNASCGSGQLHPDESAAPIIICRRCGSKACFRHDVEWHDGFTCSEYDAYYQPADKETDDYLRKSVKACPHCSRMLEKIGGCNHMTCSRPAGCGREFCWICLADWAPIRNQSGSHKIGCSLRGWMGVE